MSNDFFLHDFLLHTGLCRVLRLEDLIQLLKGTALGLHKEEVDEDKLEQIPEDEEDVEPVFDLGYISFWRISEAEGLLTLVNAIGAAKVFTKLAQPAVS